MGIFGQSHYSYTEGAFHPTRVGSYPILQRGYGLLLGNRPHLVGQPGAYGKQPDIQHEGETLVDLRKAAGDPPERRGNQDNAHINDRQDAGAFFGIDGQDRQFVDQRADVA